MPGLSPQQSVALSNLTGDPARGWKTSQLVLLCYNQNKTM